MKKKGSNSVGKYLLIIAFIGFSIWAIFEYLHYNRFDTPIDYEYIINDKIDLNYHDKKLVQDYLKTAYEIGSFANEQWYNFEIDVRFPDHEKPQSVLATKVYNEMISNLKYWEKLLLKSAELKGQGFDNKAIRYMELNGVDAENYFLNKRFKRVEIALNDSGQDVRYLQEQLVKIGYDIPVDGLFLIETKKSVIDFQSKNNLPPLGVANEQTLKKLFNNK